MADSARNGSSEGVHASVFPRTDFPQQGWIRKATVNGATNDFYEALTDFGWFSESQSYRSADKQLSYGANPRSHIRPLYQTEPQQGWIRKPTVNGLTNDLYEAITDFGWFAETQTYRESDKQLAYGANPRSRIRPFYQTEPQQGWFSSAIFDPALIGPIVGQTVDTRRWILQQLSLNVGIKSDGAAGAPPPPPFDPSVMDWTIDSGVTPQRKGMPETYLAPQRSNFLIINTPLLAPVWAQTLNDDAMPKGRIYLRPRQEQPAQDWIYTSIPPFNAQFVIHSEMPLRMAAGKRLILQYGHYLNDLSWLKDVLGLVDLPPTATHHKRPIAPIMSARRRNRRR